jgi:hypothetical protein
MPIGEYNKINKFGEQLWNGVNGVNDVVQTVAPLISEYTGSIPVVDTIVNSFGSIVNGVNEILTVNAVNKQIKEWNKQNEKEVAELNKIARQQAKEQREKKETQEREEHEYYRQKYGAKPMTQAQKDLASKFTSKDREHLENMKRNTIHAAPKAVPVVRVVHRK